MRRLALLLLAALSIVAIALGGCRHRKESVACGTGALAPVRPAVRVDEAGGFASSVRLAVVGTDYLVVWIATSAGGTDLFGRLLDGEGVALGTPVRLTTFGSTTEIPRITSGPGGVALAFRNDHTGRKEAYGAVLTSSLAPVTSALFLAPVFQPTQSPVPAVAAFGTAFRMVWTAPGADGFTHLYTQGLGNDGLAAGVAIAVSPDGSDRGADVPVAAAGAGRFAVADLESRLGATDAPDVFLYAVAGTALGATRFAINSKASLPEATVGIDGTAAVIWCDPRDGQGASSLFYGAISSGGAVTFERRLTDPGTLACNASIVSGLGFFALVYDRYSGSSRDIVFETITADGFRDGPRLRLSSDTSAAYGDRPDVATNGRSFAVGWTTPATGGGSSVWLQPLECASGAFAAPSPTGT